MKVYVWILKKMYMLTNLWQNNLCKAQYLKLQYFWFLKQKTTYQKDFRCWPCIAPGASSNSHTRRLVLLCKHVIGGRNWPVVRHEVGMQNVFSSEHTRVLRIVRVMRLKAEQWLHNSWQLVCSSGVKAARVPPSAVISVSKYNSGLRPMSMPFLLTSQLFAGEKVALYCRSLTVPLC